PARFSLGWQSWRQWQLLFKRRKAASGLHALFFGTFLPFLRAFDRPMAMACLRLFTLPARPPLPLPAVPRLYRRISRSPSRPAPREYLRFLRLAIRFSPRCWLRNNLRTTWDNGCISNRLPQRWIGTTRVVGASER